jgi:hypothetical protein
MTDNSNSTPWEPPLAGSETDALLGALDRQRWTFRWKADDLTLGGLLKHLAANEDFKFTVKLSGAPMDDVWQDNGWDGDDDWEFSSSAEDSPEYLYALYDGAVARSRSRIHAALASGGLDLVVEATDAEGNHANLRRLLFDMLEEYGRHTGHADLLREAIDGRVGEDPPAGWRPLSPR